MAFQSAGKTPPGRLERKLLASQQPPAESHCTAETARCFASRPAGKGTHLHRKNGVSGRPSHWVLKEKTLLTSKRDFFMLCHLSSCPHTPRLGCFFTFLVSQSNPHFLPQLHYCLLVVVWLFWFIFLLVFPV